MPMTFLVRLLPALLLVAAPSRVGRTETEQAVMLLVVGQATIRPKAESAVFADEALEAERLDFKP
jgi:hypothetical protein